MAGFSFARWPISSALADNSAAAPDRYLFELADDNTFVNRAWGKQFLQAIRPRGLRWFTETDIGIADDAELLRLLAEAGCKQVLIGSIPTAEGLVGMEPNGWKHRHHGTYLQAIERIQSHGISVNGCFVLGLDHQTPDIFPKLRDFIATSGLLEVQITVQTPFPGTPLYARLKHEGRLLRDRLWDRCTLFDVNFQPRQMSIERLERGIRWLFSEVYHDDERKRRMRHYADIHAARPRTVAV